MTEIKISILGANAEACKRGPLTAGMVGVPVEFTFDTSWAGLNITAVFQAGEVVKDKPLDGAAATIVPYEVLQVAGETLRIGVEGRNAAGDLVIPTTWARIGTVIQGANATGNPALEPTPSQYERLMARMETAEEKAAAAEEAAEETKTYVQDQIAGIETVTHWEDLQGKPFSGGNTQVANATICYEYTEMDFIDTQEILVPGDTYIVTWNGVDYTCTAEVRTGSEEDIASLDGLPISLIQQNEAGDFLLRIFMSDSTIEDGTEVKLIVRHMVERINPTCLPHEVWTFTLDDGTVIEKKVVVAHV